MTPPRRVLWLSHTSGRSAGLPPGMTRVSWLYLGRNYVELLAWEQAVGADAKRISIDRPLEAAAGELRRPFLDLLASLGRRHGSLAWWTSRVSERNTMVSPLFLHCCHLQVARDIMQGSEEPLSIVSESWSVLRCLEKEACAGGRDVRWLSRSLPKWRLTLRWYTKIVGHAWEFVRERIHTTRVARRIAPRAMVTRDRPCALLRTFIDDDCMPEDGEFRERFLVGVGDWFERKGYEVWTVPILFAVKRPYFAAWQWLHGSGRNFLNPDEHYRFFDFVFTIVVALRQAFIPRRRIQFRDLDVTALFDEERRRFAFDRGSLDSILLSRLPYRLKRAGWRVDTVVQGYENMVLEKGAIHGFRRHMPSTRIVGFQHCVVPPMLLCHFVTAEEAAIAPLPDRIICNGRMFRRNLVTEGLSVERVVEGPALRYAHLQRDVKRHDAKPCVLVALPLELGAAVELLSKVHGALRDDVDVPVKVKPHPMMHLPDLLRECGLDHLPDHFELVRGGMAEWLGRARVVVSSGSAVLFEAVAGGVPTVTVGRESGLNLNPLSWLKDSGATLYGPSEIRTEVQRLWRLSTGDRDAYRRRGRELLHDGFNPVTDEWMHVFTKSELGEAPRAVESPDRRSVVQPEGSADHLVNVG